MKVAGKSSVQRFVKSWRSNGGMPFDNAPVAPPSWTPFQKDFRTRTVWVGSSSSSSCSAAGSELLLLLGSPSSSPPEVAGLSLQAQGSALRARP